MSSSSIILINCILRHGQGRRIHYHHFRYYYYFHLWYLVIVVLYVFCSLNINQLLPRVPSLHVLYSHPGLNLQILKLRHQHISWSQSLISRFSLSNTVQTIFQQLNSIFKLLHSDAWKLNLKQLPYHLCQQNPLLILLWLKRNCHSWNYDPLLSKKTFQSQRSLWLQKILYHFLMMNYCLQSNPFPNCPLNLKPLANLGNPRSLWAEIQKSWSHFYSSASCISRAYPRHSGMTVLKSIFLCPIFRM